MGTEKTDKMTFEDALTMTGFGRYNLLMFILSASIITAMAFETVSVAYLVPANACELETSSVHQGLMAGMPLLGILVSSNVWGYLADTRGRRKILLVSLVLGFITGSSATLSPNWIVFAFLKFLSSSAMAGTFGLGNTFLAECTPHHRRNTLIVLLTSFFLISTGTMAALTIPILPLTFSMYVPVLDIHFNSWRLLNIIYSLPCAIAAIGVYLAYESPRFLFSVGEDEKGIEVFRRIYVINNAKPGDTYKVVSVTLNEDPRSTQNSKGFWSSVAMQTIPLFKPPLLSRTLLLSMLFVSVYFCINPYTVWVPFMVDAFMKSMEKGDIGFTFCDRMRSSQNETLDSATCTLNQTAMMMVFGMNVILAVLNIGLIAILPFCRRKTLLIGLQLFAGSAAMLNSFVTTWALSAALIVVYIASILNFGLLTTFSVDLFPTYVKYLINRLRNYLSDYKDPSTNGKFTFQGVKWAIIYPTGTSLTRMKSKNSYSLEFLKAMGVCLTLMVGRGSAVLGINIMKNLLVTNCEASFYLFGIGGIVGFLLPSEKKPATIKDSET